MKGLRSSIFGVTLLLFSTTCFALGLGEIKVNSALNEPLDAKVTLLNIGELDREEMLVGLASQQDFDRAGVDREYHLVDLRFKIDMSDQNRPLILITSSKPVREPYLDFLVELQWPAGRLLKEYTLFLDPPIFAGGRLASKPSTTTAPASADSVTRREEPAADSDAGGVGSGGTADYVVRGGDTLWGIARKFRGSNGSIQQAMLAIFEQNTDAFINGDMNLLKEGSTLALPDADGIRAVDAKLAEQRFVESAEQYRVSGSRELVSDEPVAPTEVVASDASGVLRLSSAGGDEQGVSAVQVGQASATGLVGAEQADELALAQEELASTTRENLELKEKLAQMEEQLATVTRMVELSDSQLSALQDGAPDTDSIADIAKKPEVTEAEPEADTESATATEPSEKGLFAALKNNLAIIAAALLLIVLGVLFLLARTRKEPDEDRLFPADIEADISPATQDQTVVAETQETSPGSTEGSLAAQESPELDLDSSLILAPDEKVDPIGEADIYLSVGDFAEAEAVIGRALELNARDSKLHLKLLSIFSEQGDTARFEEHYPSLVGLGDPAAIENANRMRSALPGIPADASVPETDSLTMAPEEPEIVEDAGQELLEPDEDFDLDIVSSDEVEVEPHTIATDDKESLADIELDLDLDTGLDEEEDPIVEADQQDAELENLEFDDFDIDEDLELLVEGDQVGTQLELAQAYIDMGDKAGAKDILSEIIATGDADQKAQAEEIIKQIS
jgi:pilus assembly protein FimV